MSDWLPVLVMVAAASLMFALASAGMSSTTEIMTGLFSSPAPLGWPAGVQEEDGVRFDVSAWSDAGRGPAGRAAADRDRPSESVPIAVVVEEIDDQGIPTARVSPGGTHLASASR